MSGIKPCSHTRLKKYLVIRDIKSGPEIRTREGHCRNEDVWASIRMCKAIKKKKRWTNKGKEVMIYIIRKMTEEGKRPIY